MIDNFTFLFRIPPYVSFEWSELMIAQAIYSPLAIQIAEEIFFIKNSWI